MSLYDVLYILSNIFLSHIICRFIYLFYEKCRFNKYLEFSAYFVYFVSITFVFIYFGNPIITISFNLVSIFLLTLMYDYVNIRKSLVITFLTYLFLFVIEASVLVITNFNKNNFYIANQYNNINLLVIIYSIAYVFCFFIFGIKKSYIRKLKLIFSSNIFLIFCIYPALSIILVLLNFIINNSIFLSILINLFIVVVNILVFKYCDFISDYFYNKVFMKFVNDKIRKYRREIQDFKTATNDDTENSNNSIIDSILNSKVSNLDRNVDIKFKIPILDNLDMRLDDLIIVIGNLIDSAIVGISSIMDDKKCYIFLKVRYVRGLIFLNLKSSWNKKNISKKIIYTSGVFQNHILFELSIQEIVDKYDGSIDVKHKKNRYEINILIYDIKI